jgi:hypothetical protein
MSDSKWTPEYAVDRIRRGIKWFMVLMVLMVTYSVGMALVPQGAEQVRAMFYPPTPQPINITLKCTPIHLVQPGGETSSQICEMPDGKTACLYMDYPEGWACYPMPTGGSR